MYLPFCKFPFSLRHEILLGDSEKNLKVGEAADNEIYSQEFHAEKGSMIKLQVPDSNYITKEVFDLINVYILPKKELEREVLTVNTLGIKIVGYPVK